MAELTVKVATWRNLDDAAAGYVALAVIASGVYTSEVELSRPYEQRIGVSSWDVTVSGLPLRVLQEIEQDLAAGHHQEADRG